VRGLVPSPVVKADPPLSLGEWAVLALVSEKQTHGWPLVRALAADGEIGQIWTVRRAAVYRSLDVLADRELVAATGSQASERGPSRTIFSATRRGNGAVRRWLAEPVDHVRELRSALILKLVLGRRVGIDQRDMLERQRALLAAIESSFAPRLAAATGTDHLLLEFRLETTRAASRFVDAQLAG
jgi:DNA-binding PadR family transcriptional regulator